MINASCQTKETPPAPAKMRKINFINKKEKA
jgi:hypothetical protein